MPNWEKRISQWEKKTSNWETKPIRWDERQGDYGVPHMVMTGIAAYRAGEASGLRFDVFYKDEVDMVHSLMRPYPDIPYQVFNISYKITESEPEWPLSSINSET